MSFQAVKIDHTAVDRALSGIKGGSKKALTRAINKSLTGVRTDIVKEVTTELNVTATAVRKAVKTYRANYQSIKGKATTKGAPLPIVAFKGVRQTKKGITVQIKKSRGRKLLKNAFMATMPKRRKKGVLDYEADGRHRGVFRRKTFLKAGRTSTRGDARNTNLVGRLPIQELYSTAIPEVVENRFGVVATNAQDRLDKNLAHEIDYLLSTAK